MRKDGTPTLVITFWTEQYCGFEPRPPGESVSECQWVSEGELDNYGFVGNVKDDIRSALEAFHAREYLLRQPYTSDE